MENLNTQLLESKHYGHFTNLALDNGLNVRESGAILLAYKTGAIDSAIKSKPFCESCGYAEQLAYVDSRLMCESCCDGFHKSQMERLMG